MELFQGREDGELVEKHPQTTAGGPAAKERCLLETLGFLVGALVVALMLGLNCVVK